jgi:hypothetical protein
MFIYQAVIMAAVVAAVYILTYFLKGKRRKLLLLFIACLITAGGAGLYAIQYHFGNHFYTQKVSTQSLGQIDFTDQQKRDMSKIFSDYSKVSINGQTSDAIGKVYNISGNGANSKIDSDFYLFSNVKDANNYFEASQKFYENKGYIPLDTLRSKKTGVGTRYLISFIKSQYKDYSDLIYLPSKITYSSDVVIQDENLIILITETANRPVTNKDVVLNDIETKLEQ